MLGTTSIGRILSPLVDRWPINPDVQTNTFIFPFSSMVSLAKLFYRSNQKTFEFSKKTFLEFSGDRQNLKGNSEAVRYQTSQAVDINLIGADLSNFSLIRTVQAICTIKRTRSCDLAHVRLLCLARLTSEPEANAQCLVHNKAIVSNCAMPNAIVSHTHTHTHSL